MDEFQIKVLETMGGMNQKLKGLADTTHEIKLGLYGGDGTGGLTGKINKLDKTQVVHKVYWRILTVCALGMGGLLAKIIFALRLWE